MVSGKLPGSDAASGAAVKRSPRPPHEGLALMADPIHGYIPFTVPDPHAASGRASEKELIDSPWVQRLRLINQLQSARWVYPSAEHSRFVHSMGAMHVAGRFARTLYPSLAENFPDAPSVSYLESLLRIAAMLHDVGHGPFCHFFDHNVLAEYGLTHEKLSQAIITRRLDNIIRRVDRGPSGPFAAGERLSPGHIAYLIGKGKDSETNPKGIPKWLAALKPLLSGIYTADNLDYVLRDAYMCGVAVGPVDLDRLIYYSFITDRGLTLHRAGLPALAQFLTARLYLYFNVYYHRTTRAIDIHLRDIFAQTLKLFFPYNPIKNLDRYLDLTDWSLLLEVKSWRRSPDKKKRALAQEWRKILNRDVKWKMAYDTFLPNAGTARGTTLIDTDLLEKKVRSELPRSLRDIEFRVDIAAQDPRPLNPLVMGNRQIYVYNPSTGTVSSEPLLEFFGTIPAKMVQCRIFALSHEHDRALSAAADKVLGTVDPAIPTNV